jgi:hypothetical protein
MADCNSGKDFGPLLLSAPSAWHEAMTNNRNSETWFRVTTATVFPGDGLCQSDCQAHIIGNEAFSEWGAAMGTALTPTLSQGGRVRANRWAE